jgi:hypothetical protein
MQILMAIHRLAETNTGRVKTLKGWRREKRPCVGDFRVRFTEESGEGECTVRIHPFRNPKGGLPLIRRPHEGGFTSGSSVEGAGVKFSKIVRSRGSRERTYLWVASFFCLN